MSSPEFRQRSLAQIGVLATGIARVILILVAGLLALAPWGIESADLLSSIQAAFFGFKIGDVTISLSSIALACLIFGLGFTATRVVQRWLDSTVAQKWPLWRANWNGQDPQTGAPAATEPWQTDAWQFWQWSATQSSEFASGGR